MLCYKDKTFCNSDCVNTACTYHFGEDDRAGARLWWGDDDPPVMFGDRKTGCKRYTPPHKPAGAP